MSQIISESTSIKISGGAAVFNQNFNYDSITLFSTSASEHALATLKLEVSGTRLFGGLLTTVGEIKINSAILSSVQTIVNGGYVTDGFVDLIIPPSSSLIVKTSGSDDACNKKWTLSYVKFINSP